VCVCTSMCVSVVCAFPRSSEVFDQELEFRSSNKTRARAPDSKCYSFNLLTNGE